MSAGPSRSPGCEPDRRDVLAKAAKLGAMLGAALAAAPSARSQTPTRTPNGKPDDVLRTRILALFGPATPMRSSRDDVFAAFDERFRRFAELHWLDGGAHWEAANYYDRARVYYVAWARSGVPEYLARANALAVNYRDGYLIPSRHQASAHWAQMAGVLLHYEATGDEASRSSVISVAQTFSAPYYLDNLADPDAEMDNRVQARVLTSLLYAWVASRGRDPAREASLARQLPVALAAILRSQARDGAFRFARSQCGVVKPFMTGMLTDALIEYHDLFHQDERIAPAIRKACDYLFANVWDPAGQSFWYVEADCRDEKREPAPDLNLMLVNGFGFTYARSGDSRHRDRGDAIFTSGVRRAWLQNSKTFNENYATAYRYLAYRASP